MKNNLPNDLKTLTSCRVCNNTNLKHIISLGNQHLVDFLEDTDEKNILKEIKQDSQKFGSYVVHQIYLAHKCG